MSIIVDESEPEYDVEDSPFEPRNVKVRKDKWVTEEYDIQDFLGRGKFGEVNKCCEKSTNNCYAAKFISAPTAQDKKEVGHEIEIMKRLQHKRLLQLYDAFESRNEMCLVLELIMGGELFDRVICDDFILTERACVMFMRQICEGMAYMHSKHILHLDMKPENILCLSKTGNRIKIIDFGLARDWTPKSDLRVMFGTAEFMAPEVVNYEPISPATDMWSVGVICYVLLSGLSPFMGDNDGETLSNVIKGDYDFDYPEFEDVSEDAKGFISKLLILEKGKRMTATDALEHTWLRKQHKSNKKKRKAEPTLSKTHLRKFVFRRKWQKAVNAMVALRRMGVNLRNNDFSKAADTEGAAAGSNEPHIDDVVKVNQNGEVDDTEVEEPKLPDDKADDAPIADSLLPDSGPGATKLTARKVSSEKSSGSSDRSGYSTLKRYERKKDASKGKINIQDHRPILDNQQDKLPEVDQQGHVKSSHTDGEMPEKASPQDETVSPVSSDEKISTQTEKVSIKSRDENRISPKTPPATAPGVISKEATIESKFKNETEPVKQTQETDNIKKETDSKSKVQFVSRKAKAPADYGKEVTSEKTGIQKESPPAPYMLKKSVMNKNTNELTVNTEQNDSTLKANDMGDRKNRTPSLSPHRNFRSNLQRKSADKDSNESKMSIEDKVKEAGNNTKKIAEENEKKEMDLSFNKESKVKGRWRDRESPKHNSVSSQRDLFEKKEGGLVKKTSGERDVPKKIAPFERESNKENNKKQNDPMVFQNESQKKSPIDRTDKNKIETPAYKRDKSSEGRVDLSRHKTAAERKDPVVSPSNTVKDQLKKTELPKYKTAKEPEKKAELPRYNLDSESLKQTDPPHKTDKDVLMKNSPTKLTLPRKSESPEPSTLQKSHLYNKTPTAERSTPDSEDLNLRGNYTVSRRKKSEDNLISYDAKTDTQDTNNRAELLIQIADKSDKDITNAEKDSSFEPVATDIRRGSDDRERSRSLEKEHQAKILSNVLQRFVDRERSKSMEKDRAESQEKEKIEIHIANTARNENPPTIVLKQRPPIVTESSVIKMNITPREYTARKDSPDISAGNSSDELEITIGRPSVTNSVSRLVSNIETTGKFPHNSDTSSEDDDDVAINRQTVRVMSSKLTPEPGRVQRITIGGGGGAGGIQKITIGGNRQGDATEGACSAPRFTAMRMKTSETGEIGPSVKISATGGKNAVVTERYLRPNLTSKRFNIGSKQYVQMFDTDQGQVVQRFEDKHTPTGNGDRQSSSFRQFIRKFEMGDPRPTSTFEVSNVKITSNSSRFKILDSDKDLRLFSKKTNFKK